MLTFTGKFSYLTATWMAKSNHTPCHSETEMCVCIVFHQHGTSHWCGHPCEGLAISVSHV